MCTLLYIYYIKKAVDINHSAFESFKTFTFSSVYYNLYFVLLYIKEVFSKNEQNQKRYQNMHIAPPNNKSPSKLKKE